MIILHSCQGDARMQMMDEENILKAYVEKGECLSPYEYGKKYPPNELSADLHFLRKILEESHTGLYRYSSKSVIDSVFDEAFEATSDSLKYLDFIRLISGIFNKVACGHSGWSHCKGFLKYRNENMKFFPLEIDISGNRFYVRQNNSGDPNIDVGDRIYSIERKTPELLISELKEHMSRDGNAAIQGVSEIQEYFKMAYSNFIDNPTSFNVVVGTTDSAKKEIELNALKLVAIDSIKHSRYGKEGGMGIPLRMKVFDSIKTAVYTIKWFRNDYIEHWGQDFISFTDSVFGVADEEEIEHLFIDIRGNKGGWTANGRYLFSHFINEETPYIPRVVFKKTSDFSFGELIVTPVDINDTMKFVRDSTRLMEWQNYPNKLAVPAPDGFSGQYYVLIDDMSRSCSAVFSALMKSHTDAKFIGQETGGAQCGQNGMVMICELPFTGIHISVATAAYFTNVKDPGNSRGVIPDLKYSSEAELSAKILDSLTGKSRADE